MGQKLLLFITCFLISFIAKTQEESNTDKYPVFTMYGDNYFIGGTTLREKPSSTNSDVKYRIGFAHRLWDKPFFGGLRPYLTYQQISFWDVFRESFPFRETNYNPGFAIGDAKFKDDKLVMFYFIEIEHESNGRDSIFSRSWNKISYNSEWKVNDKTIMKLNFWVPFLIDSDFNKDIMDYVGFQNLGLTHSFNEKFSADAKTQLSVLNGIKGNIELGFLYRYTPEVNRYLYIQFFHGYGENLIDYNIKKTMIRLGFTFRQNLFEANGLN